MILLTFQQVLSRRRRKEEEMMIRKENKVGSSCMYIQRCRNRIRLGMVTKQTK